MFCILSKEPMCTISIVCYHVLYIVKGTHVYNIYCMLPCFVYCQRNPCVQFFLYSTMFCILSKEPMCTISIVCYHVLYIVKGTHVYNIYCMLPCFVYCQRNPCVQFFLYSTMFCILSKEPMCTISIVCYHVLYIVKGTHVYNIYCMLPCFVYCQRNPCVQFFLYSTMFCILSKEPMCTISIVCYHVLYIVKGTHVYNIYCMLPCFVYCQRNPCVQFFLYSTMFCILSKEPMCTISIVCYHVLYIVKGTHVYNIYCMLPCFVYCQRNPCVQFFLYSTMFCILSKEPMCTISIVCYHVLYIVKGTHVYNIYCMLPCFVYCQRNPCVQFFLYSTMFCILSKEPMCTISIVCYHVLYIVKGTHVYNIYCMLPCFVYCQRNPCVQFFLYSTMFCILSKEPMCTISIVCYHVLYIVKGIHVYNFSCILPCFVYCQRNPCVQYLLYATMFCILSKEPMCTISIVCYHVLYIVKGTHVYNIYCMLPCFVYCQRNPCVQYLLYATMFCILSK